MAITIRRGTTPTVMIHIPEDISLNSATEIWVTLKYGLNVVNKVMSNGVVTISGNDVIVEFSQDETLKLPETHDAGIQIRILMESGVALASQIEPVIIQGILKDGEIRG